ncbi:MAG: transcriptional regulator, family [Verrucomicrobia bacterium]|nr:transcriptional regulator, family [Verrucomicrobiota bacterium]
MHYTQLFRSFREAKGLTLEELSRLARRHRNTVVNVESGRPVKFKTIAGLMVKMGYPASSVEMRSIALLWLESLSGLSFSRPDTEASARKAIATYGSSVRSAARRLHEAINRADLTADEIELLVFAAGDRNVLEIVDRVRELVHTLAAADRTAQLKVAEDK